MTKRECLWLAIYDLYCLLGDRVNDEAAYQNFFERHPVVFTVLGVDVAESFEKRSPYWLPLNEEKGYRPEPDFLGANSSNGCLKVIELKTPFVGKITTSRKDGNRAKFTAVTEEYISQAIEYADSIRQSREARDVVGRILALQNISEYRAQLIYGMSTDNNASLVKSLSSERKTPLEIIFYDELIDRLVEAYFISDEDLQSREGFCIVWHICVPATQVYERAFIADFGDGDKDRVSAYIERECIVFECKDSNGMCHQLRAPIEDGKPSYIRFEFSNDGGGIYMSLNVDNHESDFRLGKISFETRVYHEKCVVGANHLGKEGAHFYDFEFYILDRTMNLQEKIESFRYFQRCIRDQSHCLEYMPEHYMIRNASRNMVQETQGLKPIFREWPLKGKVTDGDS